MHSFWRQLKSKSLASLPDLHFTAFGCGDNTYGGNFNRAIRLLTTRMEQLQAVRVGEVGFGDVQAVEGHETALKPWINQLLVKCGLGNQARPLCHRKPSLSAIGGRNLWKANRKSCTMS